MIHDNTLMIRYEKHGLQMHTQICSVVSYMFGPPIVAILREMFFEEYMTNSK